MKRNTLEWIAAIGLACLMYLGFALWTFAEGSEYKETPHDVEYVYGGETEFVHYFMLDDNTQLCMSRPELQAYMEENGGISTGGQRLRRWEEAVYWTAYIKFFPNEHDTYDYQEAWVDLDPVDDSATETLCLHSFAIAKTALPDDYVIPEPDAEVEPTGQDI